MAAFLEQNYKDFNRDFDEKSYPDPLMIAKQHINSNFICEIALVCALYAYGNTKIINKKLQEMPFNIFEEIKLNKNIKLSKKRSENLEHLKNISKQKWFIEALKKFDLLNIDLFPIHRFQTRADTKNFFKILLISQIFGGIKALILKGFDENMLNCVYFTQEILNLISSEFNLESKGLLFLIGSELNKKSPLKRFNMFLRWMVRKDNVDLGVLDLPKDKLILPLDTHTFNVCTKLGLLQRKNYDILSAILITEKLKEFDKLDPVKYDFALYRIGQLKLSYF